jgi:hypothetical protein
MDSVGGITSTTQAVNATVAMKKVLLSSNAAPTRDADGDGDRSSSAWGGIAPPGTGGLIDVYA